MNEISEKQAELADLNKQIELKKRELYKLQHPILFELEELSKEQSAANAAFNKRKEAILAKCKHQWKYYEYERDNYDRDIETGYKCPGCNQDISVKTYKEKYE